MSHYEDISLHIYVLICFAMEQLLDFSHCVSAEKEPLQNNTKTNRRITSHLWKPMRKHRKSVEIMKCILNYGWTRSAPFLFFCRFASFNASRELPFDAEDALLFWINKVCCSVKQRIEKQVSKKEYLTILQYQVLFTTSSVSEISATLNEVF